jgi:pyridoxine kinase
MKKIVTIQDISCYGKCSITIALPVLSAMGIETAILPTAVLSTHTMFPAPTCRDLQDQIAPISAHWQKLGLSFDAIYTGYLASAGQIALVRKFFDTFGGEGTLRFVDPAMADGGKLYPAFDRDFPKAMASLCACADIIVPNLTEACLMTGTPYLPDGDEKYLRSLLEKLAALGTRKAVVITGVTPEKGKTGVMGMETASGKFFGFSHEKLSRSYHGTGDLFSSTAVGAMMNGFSMEDSLRIAADYTVASIRETMEHDPEKEYSVDFEAVIPYLLKRIGK